MTITALPQRSATSGTEWDRWSTTVRLVTTDEQALVTHLLATVPATWPKQRPPSILARAEETSSSAGQQAGSISPDSISATY